MVVVLKNRGLNREWVIEDPKSAAEAFTEMLSMNQDAGRQLKEHANLINEIRRLEAGGLYDNWFCLSQSLVLRLNLRTYAEMIVYNDNGDEVYRTFKHLRDLR